MSNNTGRGKYLLKNTLIFSVGNFGTKIISFVLVPLYTYSLTTAEFGVADLVSTLGIVLVPILTFNIGESVMRFCLDKDADQNGIISVGMLFLLVATVLSAFMIPIVGLFPGTDDYTVLIVLFIISNAYSQVLLCLLRGKEQLVHYSMGNILHSLCIAMFSYLLVVAFEKGVNGYLIAYIFSNLITSIYAAIKGKVLTALSYYHIDKSLMYAMLKYSVVLLPTSFMWWIMNSSDRIMISAMIGTSANGIYAVSYKLPTILSTVTSIFNQAWSYSAIKEEESIDRDEYSNYVYKRLAAITITVGLCLTIIVKPFMHIYVPKEYYDAWKYTPYLIIGFIFVTLGTFLSTSYTVHKDGRGFLFSGMTGTAINILLNYLLIPHIGVHGAAIATAISYATVFFYRVIDTRKYVKLSVFNIGDALGLIILIIAGCSLYSEKHITQTVLVLSTIGIIFIYRYYWKQLASIISRIIKLKG